MSRKSCYIVDVKDKVKLVSPSFMFTLDTASQLKAVSLENRLSGKTLDLGGGLEFEADFDSADGRIYIGGWKVRDCEKGSIDPNAEEGYVKGYFSPEFYDSKWDGYQSPVLFEAHSYDKSRFKWARTHVFIPKKYKGQEISVHIGGFGLVDFQYIRVFVNGYEIGARVTTERWHEPGCFELESSSENYSCLRFGQDNIIAVQLTGYVCRNKKLDQYDPLEGRELATVGRNWPGQFEQFITVGKPLKTPYWYIKEKKVISEGDTGEIEFNLESDCSISAIVRYKWSTESPLLHKWIEIKNASSGNNRLMNVRLGDYCTNMEPTEGEQGFPVYIDRSFFMTVADPSGWVMGQKNRVLLRQHPGKLLCPGESFSCMETILGASEEHRAGESFLNHVESRMRRVKRGHDKALSIFELFGSWTDRPGEIDYAAFVTEDIILENMKKVAKGQTQEGCHFDYYSIEFWNDYYGDLVRPGLERFPNGFEEIKRELNRLDTSLCLWIDSSLGRWSIGGNPSVKQCRTYDFASYDIDPNGDFKNGAINFGALCRAEDPYKTMFVNAFLQHIHKNNVRMLKFDNGMAICHNPKHGHLPGVYSTEAIYNAEIEILKEFDMECPDIFLMLYWGHRSPWWLLYADTLFESGLALEASTPASFPTLYARDGVILTLDQAGYWCEDIPRLGKDSLGVWLSGWSWNSSIKKERWQEGIVMDLCRGSLLFQIWSDYDWLSADERKQVALFIELLKKGGDCFRNSRLILGNPWNYEPYGYCCSNGKRAFISLNNCTWSDTTVHLKLDGQWGVKPGENRDIYMWYPEMVKLEDNAGGYKDETSIALRPFEVVLLEVVPFGESPLLSKDFNSKPIFKCFNEPTKKLELSSDRLDETEALRVPLEDMISEDCDLPGGSKIEPPEWNDTPRRVKERLNLIDYAQYKKKTFRINTGIPQCNEQSILFIAAKLYKNKQFFKLSGVGTHFAAKAKMEGRDVKCEPVIGLLANGVPWQGWRITIPELSGGKWFEMQVAAMLPEGTDIEFDGYFIPGSK
ncbi:MAG: hypothetical protein Q7J78_02915 [Clostridiales bacterium]|nr:hypothetical protein [Clostridiales bacterium]